MADIRPNQLPDAVPFNSNDKIIVDQNANGVRRAEPGPFINFIAPIASQSEAETGTDNTKRMTPLRTKQSIASEVGVTIASVTQGNKADSAVQTVNTKIGPDVIIDKSDVGLGNADNTSDMAKPVSTATQAALNNKLDNTSPRLIPSGGDTDQVLVKSSDDDYDLKWETVAAATAVSYAPQTLTEPQKTQARENINAASLGENSFVGDQEIDGSVTATEFIGDGSQLTGLVDFTIIYPNGGSEAAPANASLNSTYTSPNPFPGHAVICQAELRVDGKWGVSTPTFGGGSTGTGVAAFDYDGNIKVVTGNSSLAGPSSLIPNPFGLTSNLTTPTPLRVKVWKVGANS